MFVKLDNRVAFGNGFGQPVNVRPVGSHHHHRAGVQIGLQIGQRAVAIGLRVAFGLVPRIKPDLKTDALAKFVKQRRRRATLPAWP